MLYNINENLIDEKVDDKGGSIWESINNFVWNSNDENKEKKENALNIFSVASGHMYERLESCTSRTRVAKSES